MEGRMNDALGLARTISEEIYRDPDTYLRKLEASPDLPRQEFDGFKRTLYLSR